MTFAKHTCWDDPAWDGCMAAGCAGCAEAEAHPCAFCGYGHVFTTHNPEPHAEGGDQVLEAMGEDAWLERFQNVPYIEAA